MTDNLAAAMPAILSFADPQPQAVRFRRPVSGDAEKS
jgi:hypothetical protein